MDWIRSNRCEGGSCVEAAVEVAFLPEGKGVLIRSSLDRDTALFFTPDEWEAFAGGVEDGDFDFTP